MDVVLHLANGADEVYSTTETVKLYPREDLPESDALIALDADEDKVIKEPKGKKRP